MLRDINARLVRYAFPLRSAAVDTLVDDIHERDLLRQLQSVTGRPATDIRDYIAAPFEHPCASRFSDGSYGVLYAANSAATALRETAYHLARIYRDGNAPPMETRRVHVTMRVRGRTEDIRRAVDATVSATLYDPIDYASSQHFGLEVRRRVEAIHYDSVRSPRGGRCVGVFTPAIVGDPRIAGYTTLVWDGTRFVEEHEIRPI